MIWGTVGCEENQKASFFFSLPKWTKVRVIFSELQDVSFPLLSFFSTLPLVITKLVEPDILLWLKLLTDTFLLC